MSERLIDANKYRNTLVGWLNTCYKEQLAGSDDYDKDAEVIACCIGELDEQPTVDAEVVRRGRWIEGFFANTFECSMCVDNDVSLCYAQKTNYCPRCGAKMDLEENYDE